MERLQRLLSVRAMLDFVPEIVDNARYARVLNIQRPCVPSFSRGCTVLPVFERLAGVSSSLRHAFALILDLPWRPTGDGTPGGHQFITHESLLFSSPLFH